MEGLIVGPIKMSVGKRKERTTGRSHMEVCTVWCREGGVVRDASSISTVYLLA